MKVLLGILRTFGLTAVLLAVVGADYALAMVYKASIISPPGYVTAEAVGISGSSIVGLGNPVSGELGAFLLNSSTNSVVELNSPDWSAQPNDVSGDWQVGHGSGTTTGGDTHALLWQGTAASLVDLNPTGFTNSYAYGVSGTKQIGFGAGTATGGPFHALLWDGTAESVVDLHPTGYLGSIGNKIFENSAVGYGQTPQGNRALLWHGTADSVVNLHPAGYPESFASADSQDSQVGTGVFSSVVGGERHALLWHGTAASVVDLHPPGFIQTGATGVAGMLQVGWGQGTATGGQDHALLWAGTAASVVDLHLLLSALGPNFVSSIANDIDAHGVIVGLAGDGVVSYAVMWTPIPEPATGIILFGVVATVALSCRGGSAVAICERRN